MISLCNRDEVATQRIAVMEALRDASVAHKRAMLSPSLQDRFRAYFLDTTMGKTNAESGS